MPQALPYQLLIYVSPSANKEEIANNFPYKETDYLGIITNQILIHLAGYLYEEQTG